MENNSNIVEKNSVTGVCKGCGWQCPLDKLSCNKGRRLNGVAEVIAETTAKRPAANPRTERFLRRLNRQDDIAQISAEEQRVKPEKHQKKTEEPEHGKRRRHPEGHAGHKQHGRGRHLEECEGSSHYRGDGHPEGHEAHMPGRDGSFEGKEYLGHRGRHLKDDIPNHVHKEHRHMPFDTEAEGIKGLYARMRECGHYLFHLQGTAIGQNRIIKEIFEQGGEMSQRELTESLHLQRASVSEILGKLEVRNLIIREQSETDRRSQDIKLTDEGRKLAEEVIKNEGAERDSLFEAITKEEQTQLYGILGKLLDGWRRK